VEAWGPGEGEDQVSGDKQLPFSTADYVHQVQQAIRNGIAQERWLTAIEERGGSPELIDGLRLLWNVEAEAEA
jgi:hypothetical protein